MKYYLKYRIIDYKAWAGSVFELGWERDKELEAGGIFWLINAILFGIPWAVACFFPIFLMPGKPLSLQYEEINSMIEEWERIDEEIKESEIKLKEAKKELDDFKKGQSEFHFERGFLKKDNFEDVEDFLNFNPDKND